MLQSGLSIVGSLADALTRGIHVPGLEGTGPVWGVVAIGSAGALLLLGLIGRRTVHVPGAGRTVRAALPMLPPDVQSAVATALQAQEAQDSVPALGEWRAEADRAGARVAVPAEVPPYLFVVRQDQPHTFSSLRDLAWARPDLLGVVFDRRWMGDRRCKRESGRAERRCAARRRDSVERTWTRHGFVLVRPAAPAQPLPAPSVRPPARPAVSAAPVTTVKPTEPVTTVKPTAPVTTVKPTEPVTTVKPTEPVTTVKPTEPVTTVKPTEPVTTVKPTEPVTTVKPAEPVTTVKPAEPVTTVKPAAVMTLKPAPLPRPRVAPGAPARPRAGWRGITRGLGVLLATGAAAAAVFYLEPFDRLGEVIRAALSVETATAPPSAPVRPVVPEPSPPVGAVEKPLVAAPSPGSSPLRASRREPGAAVPTPAAPPEAARSAGVPPEPARSAGVPPEAARSAGVPPEPARSAGVPPEAARSAGVPPEAARSAGVPPEAARSAGVPVDRCVTPTPAAVALSGGEVLGTIVGVQIDSTAETPRCLYVVEREGGVQWVVDSARVQLRPQ